MENRMFCTRCGTCAEPINTNHRNDPAYDNLVCSECKADEAYLTDDIQDVIDYYQDEIAKIYKKMRGV